MSSPGASTLKSSSQPDGIGPGDVVGFGQFLIQEEIGAGGNAVVYKAIDTLNDGDSVAVKVSKLDKNYRLTKVIIIPGISDSSSTMTDDQSTPESCDWNLKMEYLTLKSMEDFQGFPKVCILGTFEVLRQTQTFLVMELLGESLDKVFRSLNHKFSMKQLLLIIDQLLERLEMIHSMGIIHGDFTPSNILVGTGKNSGLLYLTDFGASSKYKNMSTGEHVPFKMNQRSGCTPMFASRHVQRGIQQSRRDDMESLAYVLAYFIRNGQLPWMNVGKKWNKANKQALIVEMKESTAPRKLFDGYPKEFTTFMHQIKMMEYADEPPYQEFRKLFRGLGDSLGVKYDED